MAKGHLSGTAFLVNESRARMVEVSHDVYAHLWVTEETRKLWDDFAKHVYPHDDLELSIRNRYYLEHLKRFLSAHAGAVFVNIAAGFTSYPFLIDIPFQAIEVDLKHVMDFKAQKIKAWQRAGALPRREVEFFPADLRAEGDLENLKRMFFRKIKEKPSFILLEGISYYLEMPLLQKILSLCRGTQEGGSVLGIEFWRPEIAAHPVFLKLKEYFRDHFGYGDREYNLLAPDFFRAVEGYEILELTDTTAQEKVFSNTSLMERYEEILPTDFAVLKKV